MFPTTLITMAVAITTWLTPIPQHASGLIVLYGSERLSLANAEYHGYDLSGYACGGALMSPSDLGKTFWIRRPSGQWFGPCLSVDCAARKHFQAYVYRDREIAEVDIRGARALGFKNGVYGEVFVGPCPPYYGLSYPQSYSPPLYLDYADPTGDKFSYLSYVYPYPKQMNACRYSGIDIR